MGAGRLRLHPRRQSRGAGRSPGVIDIWSLREAQDLAQCVDWAGVQPWSNGKVGLNGISYYAENQWQTAALQPKHLAAICTWEGAADFYRDMAHHGGIFCRGFVQDWSKAQVYTVQNGRGTRGFKSRMNGDWVSGPETLTEEELGRNRRDFYEDCISRKLDTDEYWQSRMPDWSKVKTPLLVGRQLGRPRAASARQFRGLRARRVEQKWLEVHGIEHWTHFYTNYGLGLQKKLLRPFPQGRGHRLEQAAEGACCRCAIPARNSSSGTRSEWPLARTQWTKFYLHPADMTMSQAPQSEGRRGHLCRLGDGVTFLTEPLEQDTEITGPIAAKLWVSSATEDADLFLVVRVFTPDLKEVTFQGALDAHTPIAQGWLRCSHRKLDTKLTLPYRPYHTHDEEQKLNARRGLRGRCRGLADLHRRAEGHRLALSVRGKDYVFPGEPGAGVETLGKVWTGVGPFTHDDPRDRPPAVFGGDVTLHTGPDRQAYLLLPVIPTK